MKEYVVISPWMLGNTEVLNEWVKKSLTCVSSLPPKAQKEKRKKQINVISEKQPEDILSLNAYCLDR